MRILLIEDDPILANQLTQCLTQQRYAVDWVENGELGLEYAQEVQYDLIVTDVGLPRLDGITLCQHLRFRKCETPVLLMTARNAPDDRIRGLDAGADDYLTKPINLEELQARVRALLRRGKGKRSPILELGALRLNPIAYTVTYGDKSLNLTPKEHGLLELLLRNPTRIFSLGNIIEHLWTFNDPPMEESVKSHIKGLRQKLKAAGAVDWIENVYGLGYRLNPPNSQLYAVSSDRPIPPVPRSSSPPASLSPSSQYDQSLSDLWHRYYGLMVDRLTVLEQASTALQQKQLQPELRQAAEQAAHKLAGVLGMFERDAGTEVARQLEALLSAPEKLKYRQVRSLVQKLAQLIEAPLAVEASQAVSKNAPVPTILPSPDSMNSSVGNRTQTVVLAVDDDPVILTTLQTLLEPWGMQVTGLEDSTQFCPILNAVSPDLLILDVEMPQVGGIELCRLLRADAQWQALPVVFLTAHREPDIIQQVFSVGADDYVVKPVVTAELVARIINRLERSRLLQTLSNQEPITGLLNQPCSSRSLEQLLSSNHSGCFLLFQIQNLRQTHRHYGHLAGHLVLQQWGKLFQQRLPKDAVMGYWGDGEFVVGLPQTSTGSAAEMISEVLVGLRQQVFTAPQGERFQVQWRWAIVQFPDQGQTLQSLYQAAWTVLEEGEDNERGSSWAG